ncbi:MAG: Trk system potassium transporter TrkA [Planctomycetaceae bacterium]|nr:Trk system potassium transporter TrkA [Planctomycetaceae bacterium]MBQ2819992.1 Trk system potassium transporter TrkA [Thermoguttaceae bacterium]MDO4425068.1 Trk system potassium transporter TrkA [Planctomycetia bacterium]
MRIVILGAGTVGYSIAQMLSRHRHDVTLVDRDQEVLDAHCDSLDAMVLCGNAAEASVLFQAGVMDADLCLAVTDSDETNLIAASLARAMGANRTVARAYSPIVNNLEVFDYCDHFGINKIISLEQLTAVRLAQAVDNFSEALSLESYLYGDLEMMDFEIGKTSRCRGKKILELGFPSDVRIGAISRNSQPFVPRASDVLQENDRIAVFGVHDALLKVCRSMGGVLPQKKTIVIAGGGETGLHLAQILGKRHRVRLLEADRERCEELADILKRKAEVVHLDLRSRVDLEEEHIGKAEAFVACTGSDENNLIGCVTAREMGVKNTYCVTNRIDYGEVIRQKLEIDFMVSPREAAARRVMNFLQRGVIISHDNIFSSQIELVEIEVQAGSPISKCRLREAKLPPQCIILGMTRKAVRKNEVPGGDFQFEAGDIALIVTKNTQLDELIARFEA